MKMIKPPFVFLDGDTLSPQQVMQNFEHYEKMLSDVQSQRWTRQVMVLPFHKDVATPYTNSTATDVRTYRFQPKYEMQIERAYLRYYGTGDGSNPVNVNIYSNDAGTSYPTGSEENHLSVSPTGSDSSLTDFNGRLIRLNDGTTYYIRIESAGTFSSKNTYLELHLKSDRYNIEGTNLITPYKARRWSAVDPVDAVAFNTEHAAFVTALDSVTNNTLSPRVDVFTAHNFNNATDADQLKWTLPNTNSNNSSRTYYGVCTYQACESSSSASYSWKLKNASGTLEKTISVLFISTDTFFTNTDWSSSSESIASAGGDPLDDTEDWTLEIDWSTGTDTIAKATLYLFSI